MAEDQKIRIEFTLPAYLERAERLQVNVEWRHVPRLGEEVHFDEVKVLLLNSKTEETAFSVGGEVVSVCWCADDLVHIRLQ
jgi:hypothetical protein